MTDIRKSFADLREVALRLRRQVPREPLLLEMMALLDDAELYFEQQDRGDLSLRQDCLHLVAAKDDWIRVLEAENQTLREKLCESLREMDSLQEEKENSRQELEKLRPGGQDCGAQCSLDRVLSVQLLKEQLVMPTGKDRLPTCESQLIKIDCDELHNKSLEWNEESFCNNLTFNDQSVCGGEDFEELEEFRRRPETDRSENREPRPRQRRTRVRGRVLEQSIAGVKETVEGALFLFSRAAIGVNDWVSRAIRRRTHRN